MDSWSILPNYTCKVASADGAQPFRWKGGSDTALSRQRTGRCGAWPYLASEVRQQGVRHIGSDVKYNFGQLLGDRPQSSLSRFVARPSARTCELWLASSLEQFAVRSNSSGMSCVVQPLIPISPNRATF
jgi:hypothetical protein